MARVLVVDDERKLRRAFVLFLREDNHETESAGSLDEAIAAIERAEQEGQPHDVVVTDALPEQGGVSLMRTVGPVCTICPAIAGAKLMAAETNPITRQSHFMA